MRKRKKLEFEFVDNNEQPDMNQKELNQIRNEAWEIIIEYFMLNKHEKEVNL